MVSVGATSHHTTHEISHCRFHPCEHGPAAAGVQAMQVRPADARTTTRFGGVRGRHTAAGSSHSALRSLGERGTKSLRNTGRQCCTVVM